MGFGEIEIQYVPTAQQRGDVLTKALGGAAISALKLKEVQDGLESKDASADKMGRTLQEVDE